MNHNLGFLKRETCEQETGRQFLGTDLDFTFPELAEIEVDHNLLLTGVAQSR
jgi:hypothetical protein